MPLEIERVFTEPTGGEPNGFVLKAVVQTVKRRYGYSVIEQMATLDLQLGTRSGMVAIEGIPFPPEWDYRPGDVVSIGVSKPRN